MSRVSITLASFMLGVACGGSGACDDGACDSPDGGPDAAPEADADAGKCDALTNPSCIDDANGVFVSPTGSDSGAGSRGDPLKTIGAALTKNKPHVYVCAGTYAENVTLTVSADLLGGYACADWSYDAKNAATIAPTSGIPLHATGATSIVRDLRFMAADATSAGDSSIGALVATSTITFLRDDVEAGKGVSAQQPNAQPDYSPTQATTGKSGDGSNGGGQSMVTCTNGSGTTTGGAGGQPTAPGADGFNGAPFSTYPVNPALADGAGGTHGGTCATGLGHNGSYGPGGSAGAAPAKLGTLDTNGWTPGSGGAGGMGAVGEGGGASLDSAGGGGGGGPGGCGGVGGTGSAGGGASIALASLNSNVTLTQTTLVAKNAGDGAKGGTGQKAQGGGNAGAFFATSCNGGPGGHGGSGGGGGGGAGGISVGVLYAGTAPTIDGTSTPAADTLTSVTLGNPGALGAGGDGGPAYKTNPPASNAGTAGNAGPAGVAKAVMQAP